LADEEIQELAYLKGICRMMTTGTSLTEMNGAVDRDATS
jgi:hypothetical protein